MKNNIKTICVFASSSSYLNREYHKLAYDLGKEIALNGFNVVYGGSKLGLMGEVTTSAKNFGSEITGVMPEKLYNLGVGEGDCTKFILTKGMRERKAKMDELSQAIIALPGGFGTLEEIAEMIVQKQLGYNNKPIVFLNCRGFYDSLAEFFDVVIKERFASEISSKLYFITQNPKEAIDYIKNYDFIQENYLDRKLNLKNTP